MSRRRPDDYEDSVEYRALQQGLGRRMYRLRRATGLTQRQFAELAGISSTNYSIVEAGAGNVTLLILDRVAKALRVPIVALFDEAPGSPTADMEGLIVRLMADLDRVRTFFGTFGEDMAIINEKLKALGSGDEGTSPEAGKRRPKEDE